MQKTKKITKDIAIEDLLSEIPDSVTYLSEKGIRCFIFVSKLCAALIDESDGRKCL